MSKYQDIQRRYNESGLSQKAFAEQEGISAGMVSYYIRKARKEEENGEDSGQFKSIQITPGRSDDCCIRITTSKGVQITIPV